MFSATKHNKMLKFNRIGEKIFNLVVVGAISKKTRYSYAIPIDYDGCKLFIRPFIFREMIMGSGRWEPYLKHIIDKEITKNDVVVDVGANIGVYAIPIAKKAHKVIAFEPHPKTSEILENSIKLNRLDNIVLIKKAVGDSKKKVAYTLSAIPQESGILADSLNSNVESMIEIECIDLDSILMTENKINWVLIDVEGFELNVLMGSRKILQKYSPKIIIELHTQDLEESIKGILRNEDYEVTQIYRNYYYATRNN